jgi:hypothetical protein
MTGSALTCTGLLGQVTLYFAERLTVRDGENLQLAGDFHATPGSTLSLVAMGRDFIELSRSNNGV